MKTQQGVTLLEGLLVLVVISSIMLFSLQQYYSYRRDADVQQLQYNVDALFQAMGRYFQAYCGDIRSGQPLSPDDTAVGDYKKIDLTDLQKGYLIEALPFSPLIDTSVGDGGYIMQFNRMPDGTRQMRTADGSIVTLATILVWQVQVGVVLKNAVTAPQYQKLLSANCLSSVSGDIVTPCAGGVGSGNVVVWIRQPSAVSPKTQSSAWPSMPLLKQFKQMYDTESPYLGLPPPSPGNPRYITCTS